MGISWQYLKLADEAGIFSVGGRVLDIGSSNLYSAKAEDVVEFVTRFNGKPSIDLEAFATRIERGSGYDPVRGGLNEAFAGEVFEAAGMGYDAIDIADGYRTRLLDLNNEAVPADMRGAYDTVINCGTTEHILNQGDAFRAIHDAAKVGGHIWHQVPAFGFADHGYFCYTGRFFFDLAGYNDYEIVDMWFDGPLGSEGIFSAVNSYANAFPALGNRLGRIGLDERERIQSALEVPTIAISVVYKKKSDRPFMGTVEMSTSVGNIPTSITKEYEIGGSSSQQSDADVMRKFFNEEYYFRNNHEAVDYPHGAIQHYIDIGWKKGADPTPGFSTLGYLMTNTDVAESGMNPFLHYITHGIQEGRGWNNIRGT